MCKQLKQKQRPTYVYIGLWYRGVGILFASAALCVAAHELVHASGGIDQL